MQKKIAVSIGRVSTGEKMVTFGVTQSIQMRKQIIVCLQFAILFFLSRSHAQGYERIYPMQGNQGGVNFRLNQNSLFALCYNNNGYASIGFNWNGDTTNWQSQLPNSPALYMSHSIFGIGNTVITSNQYGYDVILTKYDSLNHQLWNQHILTGDNMNEMPLALAEAVDKSIYVFCALWNTTDCRLIKTDSDGNFLWKKDFPTITPLAILAESDSGCILNAREYWGTPKIDKFIKVKADGTVEWEKYGMVKGLGGNYPVKMLRTTTGEIVTVSAPATVAGDGFVVSKYTSNGDSIWKYIMDIGTSRFDSPVDIIETSDGGIVFTGVVQTGTPMFRYYLAKVSGYGDTCLWVKLLNERCSVSSLLEGNNGNLFVLGQLQYLTNETDIWLLMTDSLGQSSNNFFLGKVFFDSDSSCTYTSNELPLKNWLVEAKGTLAMHYSMSNDSGNYSMQTQIDNYVINTYPLSPYWQPCVINDSISVSISTQRDTIDFGNKPIVMCPWIDVSLGAPCRVRPGDFIGYAVRYCNYGTLPAGSINIEIVFPPEVTITAASLPFGHTGNTYSFTVDSVALGDCGWFTVLGLVDTSVVVGNYICASVHVTPDSICLSNYTGDDPYTDMHCTSIVASLDPNVKTGNPLGQGVQHIIEPNTQVSYVIEFQNTGTDTAFKVVILDTIPSELDITTFKAGASSNLYRYEIYGAGIIKFIFDPISLPDSNSNEPASKGFVKYSIKQKPNLSSGTHFDNRAAIYFDYNAPVITDAWTYTIGQPDAIQNYNSKLPSVQLYPNPATNQLFINSVDAVINEVALYNVTGQKLKEVKKPFQSIDVSDFIGGVYIAEIETSQGRVILRWVKM